MERIVDTRPGTSVVTCTEPRKKADIVGAIVCRTHVHFGTSPTRKTRRRFVVFEVELRVSEEILVNLIISIIIDHCNMI